MIESANDRTIGPTVKAAVVRQENLKTISDSYVRAAHAAAPCAPYTLENVFLQSLYQ